MKFIEKLLDIWPYNMFNDMWKDQEMVFGIDLISFNNIISHNDTMSTIERQFLILYYESGMSYEAIALHAKESPMELDYTAEDVMNIIKLARYKLKAHLWVSNASIPQMKLDHRQEINKIKHEISDKLDLLVAEIIHDNTPIPDKEKDIRDAEN